MQNVDLQRLIQIIVEEVTAAAAAPSPARCHCHSVLYECCPDRIRGVLEAGATRLGLHASGGTAGTVAGMIDPRLALPTFWASIAITFVTGALGNHWYRKQVQALAGNPGLSVAELEKQGGVSMPAAWIAIGIVVILPLLSGALTTMWKAGPAPAPQPASAPAAPATAGGKPVNGDQAAAPLLDRDYLIGRWSDDGNCGNSYEFAADGSFIAANGQSGNWTLDGDRLTVVGSTGSATIRVTPVDQNSMTGTGPDGALGTSTRC